MRLILIFARNFGREFWRKMSLR